jgi:outer membrane protein
MKLKQATTGAVMALACVTAAHAQSAGTFYVTTGWFHFAPQSSSDALQVTGPFHMTVPGSGASVDDADTLGLSVGYYITDHIAAEIEGGVPPRFDINGSGSLSQLGTLGHANLWAPTLLLKWNFLRADAKLRPYVGVGVTRVWFSNAQITNTAFEYGMPGLALGPTSVSTSSSWAPVFNVGFNYQLTKHWFAGASLSYIPVSVTANLTSQSPQYGPVQSTTKIRLDPLVSYVKIGYNF